MSTKKATSFTESDPKHSARHDTQKQHGKLFRMLEAFATGAEIHRFQAARQYADSVLNTTVSDLHLRYGIEFSRKWITIKSRHGHDVRIKQYWLEGRSLDRARMIVGLTNMEAAA